MITIRKANERGKTQTDWLTSFHSFSFGDYYDPKYKAFSHLRVINEDTVQPNSGFGRHPHQNMEIITYIVSGALTHEDSMGTGSLIRHGEVQRMSAGTGIEHSEFNHSSSEIVHLLQIWIIPDNDDIKPS
ncbi:MAG: pirin family protein, partial [Gammaproteobacteria bacterium]|nr:pirin family protein [Gammaproteobacteria bacterium]